MHFSLCLIPNMDRIFYEICFFFFSFFSFFITEKMQIVCALDSVVDREEFKLAESVQPYCKVFLLSYYVFGNVTLLLIFEILYFYVPSLDPCKLWQENRRLSYTEDWCNILLYGGDQSTCKILMNYYEVIILCGGSVENFRILFLYWFDGKVI